MVGQPTQLNCFTCQIRQKSEWCTLTEKETALLNTVKRTRSYSAGEVVYSQGADCRGIYCIETGLIGHRKYDAEGKSILVRLCGPGETIGYRSFLLNSKHMLTAEVLMPGRACFIERGTVQRLLTENPSLGLQFLKRAASDLTYTEDRFFRSATWSAKARVIHILFVLYQRFGDDVAPGEHILHLPLSRQDLAALIGIAPETMSRMIRWLENERIARFDGGQVHLLDVDRLLDEIEPIS